MIRVERDVMLDEVGSKRLDHIINDVMLERGYSFGHSGIEGNRRFQEFDAQTMEQERRDFENGILSDALSNRASGVWLTLSWHPIFSRVS